MSLIHGLTYINHDGMKKKGGGGGGASKQKGQKKLAPSHLIPKMHVSGTSQQINSSY
jgi:hypothetical protein